MKLGGYVIMQPSIIPNKGLVPHTQTFAESAARAWRIFIGPNVDKMDVSTRIQAWHDRGYRVKRAILEIVEDE